MSQIERGGANLGRWPADIGNVPDDRDAAIEEVADDDDGGEADRLSALPDHEFDSGSSTTRSETAAGGMPEDRSIEADDASDDGTEERRDRADAGLPLGGDAADH